MNSPKKLGIFYSNNNDPKTFPSISLSLTKLKDCAMNVDVLTNLWTSLGDNNPFKETLAWTHSRSHINQILQILQCLFTAEKSSHYDYVSFLEHDVLYPVGYFEYPNFEENIICNSNYCGINKDGFQTLVQHDKPLSQITMKFEYAKKHFLSILPNALVNNCGNVDRFTDEIVADWFCPNQPMHINHGYNFTSHFNCYSKEYALYHEYWGDHEQYKYLFKGEFRG